MATKKIPDGVQKNHSNTNFEYFLNQALAPFAILTSRNFVFTFANAAYQQLMNGRQLLGKPLCEAIPELKGQPFVTLLEKVFDTGIPFHAAEIAATALFDGNDKPTTRYFNLSYTPYKNQGGETEGVLASGYDITEQVDLKKKEQKHILNFQAYDLFMQAPVGFSLVIGDDHTLKLANEKGLSIAGLGKEIIGKTISEILPGIESQGYIELLNAVKKTGKIINLKESPVTLMKNGIEQTIYVDLVYQPYYENGEIKGVLSISIDVTEQVMARREVEEFREKFETLSNNIPNLAWIANADGWIFWYNSRWYEYTGTTEKDMEGWGWQSVHDAEKLPDVLEKWQASINTGQPFEMVFPLLGADKIFRPFLTRVVPVFNREGKLMRWFGTNTDITKQKELEQMKDDFLSITSHELKTPVTTIKAYGQIAESLLEQKGDNETLGIIKKMGTQVNKLTTLIEELLDITKIQNGKFIYKETLFDFNTLTIDVVEDMQKTTKQTIKFTSGKDAIVFGDKDKVSQVLNNLISNALKYSPQANEIILTSDVIDNKVQLSVQDFGIGISAKNQQKVFEQFYRVTEDQQSTFPGMGIGLFICDEIIKRHKGKIWIESAVDEGSTFYIQLPLQSKE